MAGSATILTLVLGLAEWSLRADASASCDGPEAMRRLHVYSEVYGWRPRPGFSAVVAGGRTTINPAGHRGAEPSRKPAGERRVVMLGDSIAFGWGVDDEDVFAARLDADPALSVVNLGVEGFGLDQTLLRFEREGLGLEADAVVLHFCLANDFVDNALAAFLYDGVTPKPYFRHERGRLVLHDRHLRRPLRERAATALEERFALFRHLRPRRGPPAASEVHWSEKANRVLARRQEAVDLALGLLDAIAERCRQHGLELLLVVHPNRRAFAGGDSLSGELFRPDRLQGVRRIDMRSHYRDRGLGFEQVALDAVGHLTPEGHRVVAEVLRGSLASNF